MAVTGTSGIAALAAARRPPLEAFARWAPALTAAAQLATAGLTTATVVALGLHLGIAAIFYVEVMLAAFIYFRLAWAMVVTAWVVVGYAVALALVHAPAPGEQLLIVVTVSIATSAIIAELAHRAERAERDERPARQELAELNHTLEERVAEQVEEIERVGQLRRFLAAQVADVVVSGGDTSLLQPHRQDVAVLFCDLRGFTRFTNSVAPGTVVAVLGEYYAAVGLETRSAGPMRRW